MLRPSQDRVEITNAISDPMTHEQYERDPDQSSQPVVDQKPGRRKTLQTRRHEDQGSRAGYEPSAKHRQRSKTSEPLRHTPEARWR